MPWQSPEEKEIFYAHQITHRTTAHPVVLSGKLALLHYHIVTIFPCKYFCALLKLLWHAFWHEIFLLPNEPTYNISFTCYFFGFSRIVRQTFRFWEVRSACSGDHSNTCSFTVNEVEIVEEFLTC